MGRFSWRRLGLIILAAITSMSLIGAEAVWHFNTKHHEEDFRWGASFSAKYARQLGLEPEETLRAMLADLGIKRLRLMSYWDELEPTRGEYEFSDLDHQLDLVEEFGSVVTLAIGLRQPRYPECHLPAWAAELPREERYEALNTFIKAVIERYRERGVIKSWQLENEVLNKQFGECERFPRQQLVEEYQLVKGLDPDRPLVVNVSNEYGFPVGEPRPDRFGFSVYRRIYEGRFLNRYVDYLFPAWWHKLRAALIERYLNRPVFIHELQAEPWGPRATQELSLEEQDKSMEAERLNNVVKYSMNTGIRTADLWGAEWWYWRMTKHGDHSLWETAREIYR